MHLCEVQELRATACPSEHQKQLRKKQTSRVAAQRSRQRHTDKADALHQQFETLERVNLALRREIQALRDELRRWSRMLQVHACLCPPDPAARAPPGPPDAWTQAEWPPNPAPHGQRHSGEQPGLFSLDPHLQPHSDSSLLLAPPASLSLGPAVPNPPPARLTSPSSAGQLCPFPELSALLPCPAAPPQPMKEKPGTPHFTPFSSALAPELTALQGQQQPGSVAVDWLGEDSGAQPLPAFPLLASAQVHL